MRYRTAVMIEAPAERVWRVLSDVAEWPDWTPTVSEVRAEAGGLSVGGVVTVKQPGRRAVDYTVQELVDGQRFQWGREVGGVRQCADHIVTAISAGRCSLTLEFSMEGALGSALGLIGSGKIRRMVNIEAASLKARVEGVRN